MLPGARRGTTPLWYNDLKTIRKMMKDVDSAPCCPSCRMPFDKGKKRPLIDECGHERCYSCVVKSDKCLLCLTDAGSKNSAFNRCEVRNGRTQMKTNGHFTPYMQTRADVTVRRSDYSPTPGRKPSFRAESSADLSLSPRLPRTPIAKQKRRTLRPSTVSVDNHAALSDDDVPRTPPRTSGGNDLYMRLGLLLGDSAGGRKNHGSFASISSLASSESNIAPSINTSPISTLTGSDPDPLQSFRSNSREHSTDSVTSLMSTSTGQSASASPLGSRNFCRHDFARLSDSFAPFGRRGSPARRSDRSAPPLRHHFNRGGQYCIRAAQLPLKPLLFFEVPQTENDPLFWGRQWLYREIQQELLSSESHTHRGIIISGCPGSGKTAAILQVVDQSAFGRKQEENIYQDVIQRDSFDRMSTSSSSGSSSLYQSQLNLSSDAVRSLASHVVAYHFCQADNSTTCLVPELVHQMAAQLCQAPQLVAYRELLLHDSKYKELLSMQSCISDPSNAFIKGIMEPMHMLRRTGKIPNTTCLILIDALNEAEFHKPDYGDTVATFLSHHIMHFPSWLKVIATVRTTYQEITKLLPFHNISIDRVAANESLQRNIHSYIMYRINNCSAIRSNITVACNKGEGSSYTRFASHLVHLSKGCMLYVKLVMDLLEESHLVVKSSSYKVIPVSLNEVYLLLFNLQFTTIKSYERVISILQVCLASLNPLTLPELYDTLNAATLLQPISWEEFLQRMEILTRCQFLVPRHNKTVMFAHPSLREWLTRREENESKKFLCDVRAGHATIAFQMSRTNATLTSDHCLMLGHHMLKAHIYKGKELPQDIAPRELQALWLFLSCDNNIVSGVSTLRNLYCPNVKVSRLLLLAGANPDYRTGQMENAPLLVLASSRGYTGMVSLLLEFGADANATDGRRMSALCCTAAKGHVDIVRILLTHGANIHLVDDNGWCPLVHAASNGHLETVAHLIQSDWPKDSLGRAAQRALVAAALKGFVPVVEYLLDMAEVRVNSCDDLSHHTPLSAASFVGHSKVCEVLLKRGAAVSILNKMDEPPLSCAVVEGHWEVAELLISQKASIEQRDGYGRTPLMFSAMEGHLGVLELLLSKGGSVRSSDKEGLTALSWACLKGQMQAVQCLLDNNADINHQDRNHRTPLDLAALQGDPDVIHLLLEKGAIVEHVDLSGMRPLDRAIGSCNSAAVSCFLHKGAKLGPQTWAMAKGKTDMLQLLLNKLLEDGTVLYKKHHLKEAVHRFQYALKKFPAVIGNKTDYFEQLKFHFYLGLSRCKRKMNELDAAVDAANLAIETKPKSYEGYDIRARARKELWELDDALRDVEEALRLAPFNPDVRRVMQHLKNDILSKKSSSIGSIGDSVPNSTKRTYPGKLLNGSTNTLDHMCAISVDSISMGSQKSLEAKSSDRPLSLKMGFETNM